MKRLSIIMLFATVATVSCKNESSEADDVRRELQQDSLELAEEEAQLRKEYQELKDEYQAEKAAFEREQEELKSLQGR